MYFFALSLASTYIDVCGQTWTISEPARVNVLQILLVGARYQTHLVVAVLQNRQWVILWTTALYQDFLAVLLLYISLVMRQSSGWACSANDKKFSCHYQCKWWLQVKSRHRMTYHVWQGGADWSSLSVEEASIVTVLKLHDVGWRQAVGSIQSTMPPPTPTPFSKSRGLPACLVGVKMVYICTPTLCI